MGKPDELLAALAHLVVGIELPQGRFIWLKVGNWCHLKLAVSWAH